jgi:hypothetical protein
MNIKVLSPCGDEFHVKLSSCENAVLDLRRAIEKIEGTASDLQQFFLLNPEPYKDLSMVDCKRSKTSLQEHCDPAEDGREEGFPMSDSYTIGNSDVILMVRLLPLQWHWDMGSPLLADSMLGCTKMYAPTDRNGLLNANLTYNTVVTKLENQSWGDMFDCDNRGCLVVVPTLEERTRQHTISFRLVHGHAFIGAVRQGTDAWSFAAEGNLGWFIETSQGELCNDHGDDWHVAEDETNSDEDSCDEDNDQLEACSDSGENCGMQACSDTDKGGFPEGSVVTLQVDFDQGTIRFWVDGIPHRYCYSGGVSGPLRWAVSMYNVGDSVQIVPDPALKDSTKQV